MHSTKLIKLTISGIGLAAMLFGCSSTSDNTGTGGSGTGGTSTGGSGTGGSGTGGSGTGGLPATGGTPGTGGIVSTGGTPGTGGIVSTGGIGGSAGGGHGGGTTGGGGHAGSGSGTGGTSSGGGSSGTFTLTSPDQAEGALFATMFTCDGMGIGHGINPELDWSGWPTGTMSFAITFIDTTLGATNQLGQHWAMWNIPVTAMQYPKGTSTPITGAMQTNKYLAPCPSGNDMYEYTVYALPVTSLPGLKSSDSGSGTSNSAGVADVEKAVGAISGGSMVTTPLGKATLHGKANPMGLD